MTTSTTRTPYPGVTYELEDRGHGPAVLLLHGGAGPQSLTELVDGLAGDHRVLLPTHPGWGDTSRPDWFTGIGRLAEMYLELLDDLDLHDVTVIGSSIGGWIAAELALRDRARRTRNLVLLNSIGYPGRPAASPPPAAPPGRSPSHPRGPSPETLATLAAYGGADLEDPALPARLSRISIPTLILWGEDDPIVPAAIGHQWADRVPSATFHLVTAAGHIPCREQPRIVLDTIRSLLPL